MHGTTTNFIFDNGEFFVAHVDDGRVRVGVSGVLSLDIPPTSALYAEVLALDATTVEAFIDAQIEAGRIDCRAFA